jgi:hypothetical protein
MTLRGTVIRNIFGLPPGADIAPGIFNREAII